MRRRLTRIRLGVLIVAMATAACASDVSPVQDDAVECPEVDSADIDVGITQVRAEKLLGLREDDAQRCAQALGWAFRVARRDEEVFALTMDYSAQRVNVEVDDTIVTAIGVG